MGGCRAGYDVARLYGIEITGEASWFVRILNRQRLKPNRGFKMPIRQHRR